MATEKVCADCGYLVMESNDDRGDYWCKECNAVLTDEDVYDKSDMA